VKRIMGPWFLNNSKGRGQKVQTRNSSKHNYSRVTGLSGHRAYHTGKQVLVKAKSTPKSMSGVLRLVSYVARIDQKKRDQQGAVALYDEFGASLATDSVLDQVKYWGLLSNEENRSKTARTLLANGDVKSFHGLDPQNQLHNIQAWHFIFSIEEDGVDEGVKESFHAAIRATVDGAFTIKGHKVIWAMHQGHTQHLHAHVVVKALSELGGRLRSTKDGEYLFDLRKQFAKNLRHTGLDYHATRRMDRAQLRQNIMAGHEPLDGRSDPYEQLYLWQTFFGDEALEGIKRLADARTFVQDQIEAHASQKNVSVIAGILREHLDEDRQRRSWIKERLQKMIGTSEGQSRSQDTQKLYDLFGKMYHKPEQALESWECMSLDGAHRDDRGFRKYPNKKLARWTLLHRPEFFGPVKSGAFEVGSSQKLKKFLNRLKLSLPEDVLKIETFESDFMAHRSLMRTHKNRQRIIKEFERLKGRVEDQFTDSRLARTVGLVIQQSQRIEIGQIWAIREQKASAVPPPVARKSRSSTSSSSTGTSGTITPSNDNEKSIKVDKTPSSQSRHPKGQVR